MNQSLDMEVGKDRALLRRAISQGWGLTHEDLDFYAKVLKVAAKRASESGNIREMNACVKTAAYIASMVQADEHHADSLEVADKVQVHEHRHYVVKPPRLLGEG